MANKHDLLDKAEFTEDHVMEIAEAFMAPYYLTSAKTGDNVNMLFKSIASEMVMKFGMRRV